MAQVVQTQLTAVSVVSDRPDIEISGNTKDEGHVASDTVIEINPEETSSSGTQVTNSKVSHDESVPDKVVPGGPEIMVTVNQSRDDDSLRKVDEGTSGCSITAAEDCGSDDCMKVNSTRDLNKHLPVNENDSCTITIKRSESNRSLVGDFDGEMVCRICHLSSEQPFDSDMKENIGNAAVSELIRLGCGCKDELGIAHTLCAEAWFKLKGNRLCEICGDTARNISGVWDDRFIDKWNDRLSTSSNISGPPERARCWRGQPFCNFLMACLVIAFVLPWFFRVKMF